MPLFVDIFSYVIDYIDRLNGIEPSNVIWKIYYEC